MKKIKYTDLNNQQIIDIRSQVEYQEGHLEGSLNLNPGNFKKYALNLLTTETPIVFLFGNETEEELAELEKAAENTGFTKLEGFLPIEDIPTAQLKQSATISATDFLKQEGEYILLDVRHPDEITRIAPEKNLVNIPIEALADSIQRLDHNKDIYTLCGSGNRGTTAASYLATKGFKPTVITGGMKAVEEVTNK